ncbi:MAG: hypothetical protein PHD67_07470 [Oscillospiraceae bacterium]|nr:hypothetical protein [Oscillospiraceae bacterium]
MKNRCKPLFYSLAALMCCLFSSVTAFAGTNPATGDESNAGLMIGLLAGSLVLIVLVIVLSVLGKKGKKK